MPQIPETFETLQFVPYYWNKIKSLILEKLNDYVLKPTTDTTIANGDKLVITDASNSNKIERTSIVFDGSTITKALTQKGTWETFLQSAPVTSVNGQTGAVNLTIPSAPGTLNTTATTAQSTSSSEALSGNITLHKVAKTGTYNDLIGKPTIPTVNNATLTIQKNGTTVNTFTANASSNVTANIQVNELPTVSSSDNGKVLQVVNGAWSLVTPTAIYSGTSAPDSNTGNNGDIYLQTS